MNDHHDLSDIESFDDDDGSTEEHLKRIDSNSLIPVKANNKAYCCCCYCCCGRKWNIVSIFLTLLTVAIGITMIILWQLEFFDNTTNETTESSSSPTSFGGGGLMGTGGGGGGGGGGGFVTAEDHDTFWSVADDSKCAISHPHPSFATNITSYHDMYEKVQAWRRTHDDDDDDKTITTTNMCLSGPHKNKHCRCSPHREVSPYDQSHENNKHLHIETADIKAVQDTVAIQKVDYDVLLFGSDITHGWLDDVHTDSRGVTTADLATEYFGTMDNETQTYTPGEVSGLVWGTRGARMEHLLWQINHVITPSIPSSKIVWLLVDGHHDFQQAQCRPEVIVVHILEMVQTLLEQDPDRMVVINGFLPHTNDASGFLHDGQGGLNPYFARLDAINKRLECFAASMNSDRHRGMVYYFDPLPYFTSPVGPQNKLGLKVGFYEMKRQYDNDVKWMPSVLARREWGKAIVQTTQSLVLGKTDKKLIL